MTGFAFHPEARSDLDEKWEHVAADNVEAAERTILKLLDAVADLVHFPRQGHLRADLTDRPLRFWRVYDYLVAYAPDERPLWVVAVLHGRRDPTVLSAILRGRTGQVGGPV